MAQNLKTTTDEGPRKQLTKSEKEWVNFFASEFGPIIVLVLWFSMGDLEKASFYAPSPDECKTASVPLGRLADRAEKMVNAPPWAREAIFAVVDLKDLGFAVAAYLDRIGVMDRLVPYYTGMAARMKAGGRTDGQSTGGTEQVQSGPGEIDISRIPVGIQHLPA